MKALQRLKQRLADAWRPKPRIRPSDWIPDHVRLDPDTEAGRVRYDLAGRPWWIEVLDAVADPIVRTITLMASTQVGKTLVIVVVILYLAAYAPAAAMVVLPDRDAAIEFRDRLYANAAKSGFQVPPEHRWNTRHMDVGGMRIYLAWSGSKQRLRGRRCKYVFLSETDAYRSGDKTGNPIEAASQRTKAFPRSLIVRESSPIPEPSPIDALYDQSDKRRWACKCPVCGTEQRVNCLPKKDAGGLSGLRDSENQYLDPDQARREAHYKCVKGCKISDDRKHEFATSGRWVIANCKLKNATCKLGRHVGYQLWAFHSHKTFGEIGSVHNQARRDGNVPDVFQNWFGLSFKQRGGMPTWKQLGERLSVDYARGSIPAWAWFLTASADVQADEVYVAVRAWGDQRRSALIDWWVFQRAAGDEADLVKSDLNQIAPRVLEVTFPLQRSAFSDQPSALNPRGKDRLAVALMGIDAKYRTLDVHNWIRSLKTARVRAVQGDGQMKPAEKYKRSVVKESKRERDDGSGKVVYEGGLELWSINSDVFRLDLEQRFRGGPDDPGAFLLPAGIRDEGRFYLQQLVNEPLVWTRGKDGRKKLERRERDTTIGHDFWDVEVNQSCIAQMVVDQMEGNPGWDARLWPRPEGRKQGETGRRGDGETIVARDFE